MSRSSMFARKPKRNSIPKAPREVRMSRTFWNGEPTMCTRVRVKMLAPIPEGWWCAGMEGTIRDAVKVEYRGDVFYIDNQGGLEVETVGLAADKKTIVEGFKEMRPGDGWLKVTLGMGSPDYGHCAIQNCEEVVG